MRRTISLEALMPLRPISTTEVEDLVAFLQSLSDPKAAQSRLGIPEKVLSGLSVEK